MLAVQNLKNCSVHVLEAMEWTYIRLAIIMRDFRRMLFDAYLAGFSCSYCYNLDMILLTGC